MAIIFKPKTRVKKLQYGGSVPVYSDFDYTDAKQQVYNPVSLLKKYGSDTPKAASKSASAPAAPKANGDGLDNDNADFYNTYNKLKSIYESGMSSNEYYGDTQKGKQVKSALDRHTSLGIQQKKRREKLYDGARAKVGTSETGGNWMFSGGAGMMRKYNEEKNEIEYKKRVPIKDLSKFEEEGWQKLSVSGYMNAAAHEPYFAGETKLLHTVQNIVNENDVLKALDAEFNDIGVANNNKSTTYGNVPGSSVNASFSKENLKKFVTSRNNTTNVAGLDRALKNVMKSLTPSQQDAIRSSVIQNTNARTVADVNKGMTEYIAQEMLKRVDTDYARSDETVFAEQEEVEDTSAKAGYDSMTSGKWGPYLHDMTGSNGTTDQSVEVMSFTEDGTDGDGIKKTETFRYQGSQMRNLTKKILDEQDENGNRFSVKKGVAAQAYDMTTAVIANAPGIDLSEVKVGIKKGIGFGFTEEYSTPFLDAAVFTDKTHIRREVPTYNGKIITFTPDELQNYSKDLEAFRTGPKLVGLNGDEVNWSAAQKETWNGEKNKFTNEYFKLKTGGTPQKVTMKAAANVTMAMETHAIEQGSHKRLGSRYGGKLEDQDAMINFGTRNIEELSKKGLELGNDQLGDELKEYKEFTVTVLLTPLANSIFIGGKEIEMGADKFNLTAIQGIYDKQMNMVNLSDYLGKMVDRTKK